MHLEGLIRSILLRVCENSILFIGADTQRSGKVSSKQT